MDQAALWREFKERGCQRAREELILAHLRYVARTMRNTVPNVPTLIERDDLEAEARLAVVRAIDRFDPGRGVSSSTWVITAIRHRLREYLREQDWVPRSVREAERRGEVIPLVVVSFEALGNSAGQEEEDSTPVSEALRDPGPSPFEQLAEEWEKAAALGLLQWLPRRERAMLICRYRRGETLAEIGLAFGRTPRGAENAHQRALARLRALAARQGLIDYAP